MHGPAETQITQTPLTEGKGSSVISLHLHKVIYKTDLKKTLIPEVLEDVNNYLAVYLLQPREWFYVITCYVLILFKEHMKRGLSILILFCRNRQGVQMHEQRVRAV